jgi:hypothetical protein
MYIAHKLPFLAVSIHSPDLVVLFTGERTGMCVACKQGDSIGEYGSIWVSAFDTTNWRRMLPGESVKLSNSEVIPR